MTAKKTDETQATAAPVYVVMDDPHEKKMAAHRAAAEAAATLHLDETVPGGLYRDAYGRYVDANGQRLDVAFPNGEPENSGELTDKAQVSAAS